MDKKNTSKSPTPNKAKKSNLSTLNVSKSNLSLNQSSTIGTKKTSLTNLNASQLSKKVVKKSPNSTSKTKTTVKKVASQKIKTPVKKSEKNIEKNEKSEKKNAGMILDQNILQSSQIQQQQEPDFISEQIEAYNNQQYQTENKNQNQDINQNEQKQNMENNFQGKNKEEKFVEAIQNDILQYRNQKNDLFFSENEDQEKEQENQQESENDKQEQNIQYENQNQNQNQDIEQNQDQSQSKNLNQNQNQKQQKCLSQQSFGYHYDQQDNGNQLENQVNFQSQQVNQIHSDSIDNYFTNLEKKQKSVQVDDREQFQEFESSENQQEKEIQTVKKQSVLVDQNNSQVNDYQENEINQKNQQNLNQFNQKQKDNFNKQIHNLEIIQSIQDSSQFYKSDSKKNNDSNLNDSNLEKVERDQENQKNNSDLYQNQDNTRQATQRSEFNMQKFQSQIKQSSKMDAYSQNLSQYESGKKQNISQSGSIKSLDFQSQQIFKSNDDNEAATSQQQSEFPEKKQKKSVKSGISPIPKLSKLSTSTSFNGQTNLNKQKKVQTKINNEKNQQQQKLSTNSILKDTKKSKTPVKQSEKLQGLATSSSQKVLKSKKKVIMTSKKQNKSIKNDGNISEKELEFFNIQESIQQQQNSIFGEIEGNNSSTIKASSMKHSKSAHDILNILQQQQFQLDQQSNMSFQDQSIDQLQSKKISENLKGKSLADKKTRKSQKSKEGNKIAQSTQLDKLVKSQKLNYKRQQTSSSSSNNVNNNMIQSQSPSQQQQQQNLKSKVQEMKQSKKPFSNLSHTWQKNEKYLFSNQTKKQLIDNAPPPSQGTGFVQIKSNRDNNNYKIQYLQQQQNQQQQHLNQQQIQQLYQQYQQNFDQIPMFESLIGQQNQMQQKQNQNDESYLQINQYCVKQNHERQVISNVCLHQECEFESRLMCNLCELEEHHVHCDQSVNIQQILNSDNFKQVTNWPVSKKMQEISGFQDLNEAENHEDQIKDVFQIFRKSLNKQLDGLEKKVLKEYNKRDLKIQNFQEEFDDLMAKTFDLQPLKEVLNKFRENQLSYKETSEKAHLFATSVQRKKQEIQIEKMIEKISEETVEIPKKRQIVNTLQLKLCEKIKLMVEKFDQIQTKYLFQNNSLCFNCSFMQKQSVKIYEDQIVFQIQNLKLQNQRFPYQIAYSDIFYKSQKVHLKLNVKSRNFGRRHIYIGILPDGQQKDIVKNIENVLQINQSSLICISCGGDAQKCYNQFVQYSGKKTFYEIYDETNKIFLKQAQSANQNIKKQEIQFLEQNKGSIVGKNSNQKQNKLDQNLIKQQEGQVLQNFDQNMKSKTNNLNIIVNNNYDENQYEDKYQQNQQSKNQQYLDSNNNQDQLINNLANSPNFKFKNSLRKIQEMSSFNEKSSRESQEFLNTLENQDNNENPIFFSPLKKTRKENDFMSNQTIKQQYENDINHLQQNINQNFQADQLSFSQNNLNLNDQQNQKLQVDEQQQQNQKIIENDQILLNQYNSDQKSENDIKRDKKQQKIINIQQLQIQDTYQQSQKSEQTNNNTNKNEDNNEANNSYDNNYSNSYKNNRENQDDYEYNYKTGNNFNNFNKDSQNNNDNINIYQQQYDNIYNNEDEDENYIGQGILLNIEIQPDQNLLEIRNEQYKSKVFNTWQFYNFENWRLVFIAEDDAAPIFNIESLIVV
ncbi:hypothetical protein PPERSA_02545 [Pseudocohnilembus persalinus]|uniref:Uncharacterized protein n=1 Tax=Pseudocohnilembus persalinus TaxID=266149 RepID=A0A0V0R5D1_PSEPJ|nr:hypothetical protein PPERSA_02545 [Pseudocohnilembus persalinus]|eukprot:KRX09673.1 hypothetical protein PPERSA_02545 [Pseudocohnilembus persalinus]